MRIWFQNHCLLCADNAYDPDVAASELRIDKCVIHGKPCLLFQDNGSGMDFEHLLKMLRYVENKTNFYLLKWCWRVHAAFFLLKLHHHQLGGPKAEEQKQKSGGGGGILYK